MNLSFHPTAPHFGAVFKHKPCHDESLPFEHGKENGQPAVFYATGEERAALQLLSDNLKNANLLYDEQGAEFHRYKVNQDDRFSYLFEEPESPANSAKIKELDKKLLQKLPRLKQQ